MASGMLGAMPVRLYNKDTNQLLGDITDEQLQELIDLFEEEHDEDRDYYVNADTITYMKDKGADDALVTLLSEHIGDDGIEVEWRKE
jgi:hypothetical protein